MHQHGSRRESFYIVRNVLTQLFGAQSSPVVAVGVPIIIHKASFVQSRLYLITAMAVVLINAAPGEAVKPRLLICDICYYIISICKILQIRLLILIDRQLVMCIGMYADGVTRRRDHAKSVRALPAVVGYHKKRSLDIVFL